MKNLVLTGFILVMLCSCGRKLPSATPRNTPSVFKITALETTNISEEVTGNDEIHLMLWFIKDSLEASFIEEYQDSAIFSKIDSSFSKKLTIQYQTDSLFLKYTRVMILLLEVDQEDRNGQARFEIIEKRLKSAGYHYDDSLQIKLTKEILDDDVLGFSLYQLSELKKNSSGVILFSGMQIFDRYFYRIRYTWE